MKHYFLRKEDVPEAKAWLLENVGSENVRWWFDSDPMLGSQRVGNEWVRGSVIWLDLNEDELANLTWFTMRWG